MDDVSDIFSLYSHPMTVGGGTSEGSDPLPTPLDHPAHRPSFKSAVTGPRSIISRRENDKLVRAYSEASDAVRSRYADGGGLEIVPESLEYMSPHGPEPYEEYFAVPVQPVAPASRKSSLQRQKSTKELINRFESLSSDGSRSAMTRPSSPPKTAPSLFTPTAKAEKKGSPLRQSFRSLMSVFKKGKKSKDKSDPYLTLPKLDMSAGTLTSTPYAPPSSTEVDASHPSSNRPPGSRFCTSPNVYALHSGPLLYLSRPHPASTVILPVWMNCEAVLHNTHVLLSAPTAQGVAATNIVSLSACTDVRSLSAGNIDAEEQALLPAMEGSENPKVFEVVFAGKDAQRFAAPTVQDRAAWVSAIWDAILKAQDQQTLERRQSERRSILHVDTSATASCDSSRTTTPVSAGDRLPSPVAVPSSSREASIDHPAVSDEERPSRLSAASPEQPPSPPPKTQSVLSSRSVDTASHDSRLSTPPPFCSTSDRLTPTSTPPSRAPSPSIMNLDRRSVVKQRLAEMQRTQSVDARTTTARSTRSTESRASSNLTPHTRLTSTRASTRSSAPSSRGTSIYSKVGSDAYALDNSSRLTSPVSATSESSHASHSTVLPPGRPKSAFGIREEMRQRDRMERKQWSEAAGTPSAMERDETRASATTDGPAPSQYAASVPEDDVTALLDVMDAHAERQLDLTADIGDQLSEVHEDVKSVAQGVRAAISERGQDSRNIAEMRDALDGLRDAVLRSRGSGGSVVLGDQGKQSGDAQILQALQDIQEVLKAGQSAAGPDKDGYPAIAVYSNERPSAFARPRPASPAAPSDFSDIQRKLDALLSISQASDAGEKPSSPVPGIQRALSMRKASGEAGDSEAGSAVSTAQLQEIMSLLRNEEGTRTLQMEQQADSVRYLNELNMWLEAFVNNGTAQIQAVAEGVQKLCEGIGAVDELRDAPKAPEDRDQPGLLGALNKLLAEGEVRNRDSAALQSTLDGLAAALNDDMRKNAEMRSTYTTESVFGLIDRQRQDQERMLRTLASELSEDIRGERLRFVEAMKEATAINVQIHVEEFKKELTREVIHTTQEVDRLQRERQVLEQQIADLFAFYAKQKQAAAPSKHHAQPTAAGPSRGASRRRALPNPPPGQRH
ncbi:hypothetical protein FA95DRAFT_1566759 [Auriscalpium vulgare]|uniref:Uncharacterized protein n=1 Tax=Auriscalpium vulgare TaxID=40419 RepID=A0ACB8R816_9AGAM|nr:hypothetical protein FA95DRAFT_1566759 [Auriscalpium vulgare]